MVIRLKQQTVNAKCSPGKNDEKQDVWHYQPPRVITKLLNILLGITSFTQADFTTLSKGGARIIFASLYPFEKGFFINSAGSGPLSAWLSDKITGIGYRRVRNLQQHTDYFSDLEVYEGEELKKSQTIEVNTPLHYNGYYFYQYAH